jgi:hypothetical protein
MGNCIDLCRSNQLPIAKLRLHPFTPIYLAAHQSTLGLAEGI